MTVNSVELSTETIPSQAGNTKFLGVCREHGPSPEGKMCSELYGDIERSAEMTDPAFGQVTACNTKYLHWRPHARRNMVPLDPDRFSINQDAMIRLIGWAGNINGSATLH